jgi:hypothetical protein
LSGKVLANYFALLKFPALGLYNVYPAHQTYAGDLRARIEHIAGKIVSLTCTAAAVRLLLALARALPGILSLF